MLAVFRVLVLPAGAEAGCLDYRPSPWAVSSAMTCFLQLYRPTLAAQRRASVLELLRATYLAHARHPATSSSMPSLPSAAPLNDKGRTAQDIHLN